MLYCTLLTQINSIQISQFPKMNIGSICVLRKVEKR